MSAFLGSLPQRPWRQRPRSSPTPLYQSSLDRHVSCVHIHALSFLSPSCTLTKIIHQFIILPTFCPGLTLWSFFGVCLQTCFTTGPTSFLSLSLSPPADSHEGLVTGTAAAVGSAGARTTTSPPRHPAGPTVLPSPSVSRPSAWARGKLRWESEDKYCVYSVIFSSAVILNLIN